MPASLCEQRKGIDMSEAGPNISCMLCWFQRRQFHGKILELLSSLCGSWPDAAGQNKFPESWILLDRKSGLLRLSAEVVISDPPPCKEVSLISLAWCLHKRGRGSAIIPVLICWWSSLAAPIRNHLCRPYNDGRRIAVLHLHSFKALTFTLVKCHASRPTSIFCTKAGISVGKIAGAGGWNGTPNPLLPSISPYLRIPVYQHCCYQSLCYFVSSF